MIFQSEAELLAEAQRLVTVWQPILVLQEWRVMVVIQGLENKRALIESHRVSLIADLRLDPRYWLGKEHGGMTSESAENWTLEETVLHELMHLRVLSHARASEEDREDEEDRFVTLMARILKGLKDQADGVWPVLKDAYTVTLNGGR